MREVLLLLHFIDEETDIEVEYMAEITELAREGFQTQALRLQC